MFSVKLSFGQVYYIPYGVVRMKYIQFKSLFCVFVNPTKEKKKKTRLFGLFYPVSMSLSGYATFLIIYFTSFLASVPAGTEVL